MTPEERARQTIDQLLTAAGWAVQDFKIADIHAVCGVAIREFVLEGGRGFVDYLLYTRCRARSPNASRISLRFTFDTYLT